MASVRWVRVAFLSACLAAVWQSPAFAIKNCYDYGIYRLTGTDPNPPSDKSIRASGEADLIKKLQHPKYDYERVAPTPAAKELLAGDVVLMPGHCGYVIGPDLVDHFIQVYGTTAGLKNVKYDAKRLPYRPADQQGNRVKGGLYPRDTLKEFLDIRSKPAAGYQVWRRKAVDPSGTWDVTITDPHARYNFRWDVRSTGPSTYQVEQTLVDTTHPFHKQRVGKRFHDYVLTRKEGVTHKLDLEGKGDDANPGDAGYFKQTAVLTLSGSELFTVEDGTHKGSSLTNWLKFKGRRRSAGGQGP